MYYVKVITRSSGGSAKGTPKQAVGYITDGHDSRRDPAAALPHARAAVRLGTADAVLWYHLAAVEADLGMSAQAAGDLTHAFAINRYLTLRDLPAAQALAHRLGVAA